jgi:hypothetical protein
MGSQVVGLAIMQIVRHINREREVASTVEGSFLPVDEHRRLVIDCSEVQKHTPAFPTLRHFKGGEEPGINRIGTLNTWYISSASRMAFPPKSYTFYYRRGRFRGKMAQEPPERGFVRAVDGLTHACPLHSRTSRCHSNFSTESVEAGVEDILAKDRTPRCTS